MKLKLDYAQFGFIGLILFLIYIHSQEKIRVLGYLTSFKNSLDCISPDVFFHSQEKIDRILYLSYTDLLDSCCLYLFSPGLYFHSQERKTLSYSALSCSDVVFSTSPDVSFQSQDIKRHLNFTHSDLSSVCPGKFIHTQGDSKDYSHGNCLFFICPPEIARRSK